jgi:hypothetical protein
MAKEEDKGKSTIVDHSDIMGDKPYSVIGPGRSTEETKSVVDKLKKKKADGKADAGNFKDGEKANVGSMSDAIGNFVNRK